MPSGFFTSPIGRVGVCDGDAEFEGAVAPIGVTGEGSRVRKARPTCPLVGCMADLFAFRLAKCVTFANSNGMMRKVYNGIIRAVGTFDRRARSPMRPRVR